MNFKATISESNQAFVATFGEVHNISDGGYERGFEAGKIEGYENGKNDGITEGIEQGKAEGYTQGKADGLADGIEQGKQAEYDAFWDAYQSSVFDDGSDVGQRTYYARAFANRSWNDKTFNPKYSLKVTDSGATMMFYETGIADLAGILNRNNIVLDTSEGKNFTDMFRLASYLTSIPILDFRKATHLVRVFMSCTALVTIEKLILSASTAAFSDTFSGCSSLENIVIEGTIAKNGLNLQWSTQLTHDSLMSIINALADKSGDTSGTVWTLTLGSTNIAKLTEDEQRIVKMKGWTLA